MNQKYVEKLSVVVILVVATMLTSLANAGVERLTFSDKETLTRHISKNQPDMSEEEIAGVLELPRIDDGEFLYVSDSYETAVVFSFDKVKIAGPMVVVTYTGEVLYDYDEEN